MCSWRHAVQEYCRSVGLKPGGNMKDRKESYQQLKKKHDRLLSSINNTTEAIYCFEYELPISISLPIDVQVEQFYNGVLVECNSAFANAYGARSVEEVLGLNLTGLSGKPPSMLDDLISDFIRSEYCFIDRAITEKFFGEQERHIVNNSHAVIENRVLLRIWGSFRDVTEQKQAEKDRDSLADQLRTLLENSPDFLYFKDTNRRFVRASKTFCDLFNCSMEDIIGKKDDDLFPQHVAVDTVADDLSVIETGQPLVNREEGGGELPWVITTKLPWYDDKGKIIGLFGITRDITDRKQAEDALRESEERYRTFFETAFEAIVLMHGLVYIEANSHALELFGCSSRDQLIGKTSTDFSPKYQSDGEQSENKARRLLDLALSGYPQTFEWIHQRFDGTTFEAEISLRQTEISGEGFGLAVLRDITRRNQTQREVVNTSNLLQAVFNESNLGMVVVSFPDQQIQVVNQTAAKIFGEDIERYIGVLGSQVKPTWKLFGADGKQLGKNDHPLPLLLHGKTMSETELRLERLDGSSRWGLVRTFHVTGQDGNPTAGVITFVDITERKKAEGALQEREERYRKLVEICPDMVSVTIDGILEFVNPAFMKAYGGIDPSQFIGKKIEQFIHPDEHAKIRERIKKQLETGLPVQAKEVRLIRQDGSTFFGESAATPFSYKGTTAIQAIIRDITERKRAEEEKLSLELQVQHAQKLESMGVLAGGIAHDFNNLLVGVLGNADMALMDLNPESPVRSYIEKIQNASARLADLTQQMLAYSGKSQIVVETLDLSRLVEEMAPLLNISTTKKVDIKLETQEDLPPIKADANQITTSGHEPDHQCC